MEVRRAKASRHGIHAHDKVRMAMYISVRKKAIAVHIADVTDMTLSDIMWKGIEAVGIGAGVLKPNGMVDENSRKAVEAIEEIIKEDIKSKGVKNESEN